MIYSTFSQLKSFYLILLFGLIFSILILFFKIIFLYKYSNIIFKNIQLFIYSLLGALILIFAINVFNYGEYNIILLSSFLLEFLTINRRQTKLLDFFSSKVYHCYITIVKWERIYFARKFGSIQD